VIAREEALLDPVEPGLRTIRLALRAMAIATGVVAIVQRAAVVAPIQGAAEARRATVDDVVQGATVGRQEAPGVCVEVRRPSHADDLRQLEHEACARELRAWHQLVDGIARRVPELSRDVGVDRRRAGTTVT